MPTAHYLPIPPGLRSAACDTVSRRVAPLPFVRDGIGVSGDLIAAGMECLNAEATRTLAIRQRTGADGRVQADGLDRLLATRDFSDPEISEIVSNVLRDAGIAEPAVVSDWRSHRTFRGIRLLPVWAWHFSSGGTRQDIAPGTAAPGPDVPPQWTELCPVCHNGTLTMVTGQRLFGIPETDFFACTQCGAKFVPEGEGFRLVAITRIQDPLWKRNLNTNRTPHEWATIASPQKTNTKTGSSGRAPPAKKKTHDTGPAPFTRMKDGTLGFSLGNQTHYFRPLHVEISRGTVTGLFSKATKKVRDVIHLQAYPEVRPVVEARYTGYLDQKIGFFLSELKGNNDSLYRSFLNPYGDEDYCRFRVTDPQGPGKDGVWIVVTGITIRAVGVYHNGFAPMINEKAGSILPSACYRDGDEESCRINALICRNRTDAGVYVHQMAHEPDMTQLLAALLPLCSDTPCAGNPGI
ncbi:MAG: hypothetical protein NTW33_07295 [Methanoregula sp.]|nr:hypothetical protein [Methanoregula sp.]